jgi:hypothetical protein
LISRVLGTRAVGVRRRDGGVAVGVVGRSSTERESRAGRGGFGALWGEDRPEFRQEVSCLVEERAAVRLDFDEVSGSRALIEDLEDGL